MSPELHPLTARRRLQSLHTSRHGHTSRQVWLRRPGLLGTFLVSSDDTRPTLVWRSNSSR